MVKDRLPELKLTLHSNCYSVDGEVRINFDKKSNEVTQFLNKVEKIRNEIGNINTNIDEIKKLNGIILSLPRGNGTRNSEVEERKAVISRTIKYVQNHIKEIENVVEKEKETPVENLSTLEKIKRIQYTTLLWMFAEAVKDYNEMLLKHQERCKTIVRQQLRIMSKQSKDVHSSEESAVKPEDSTLWSQTSSPDLIMNHFNPSPLSARQEVGKLQHSSVDQVATSDELEDLLEKDGAALFVDNIVADTLEAQLALACVKERHEELLNVEKSLQEINEIFVQMATLVEAQGENIKRIEYHATKAGGYSDHGNKQLRKTLKMKRKRKRNICFLVIIIILIAIVIILLII